MTDKQFASEELFPAEYETPRVVTHSGKALNGKTVDVNACDSAWDGGPGRSTSGGDDEGGSVRTY